MGPQRPVSSDAVAPSDATKAGVGAIEAAAGDQASSIKLSATELLALARDKSRSTSERLEQLRVIDEHYPNSPEAKQATALRPELETQLNAELNPVGQQWSYDSQTDDMSGKDIHTARVTSANSFEFDFPYSGQQQAKLLIRRHPRWGNDVILSIDKGQILCHSFSSCPIRVRFDDETAKTLTGNEPSDNSSESVFIPGYENFTRKLGSAKRVRIEFNVYQQGSVMAEFDVSGFDRKRLSK
ncbi:hypothetical protein [Lysobacter capsici]|uniref:hypothetical protein n=1 Tax=Lysobacter capsici TaxID=435897 RepID=UPI002079965D|nr:hypothetical protein [Lysobacter capsici]